ncbi:MAG: DUF4164 domain-containing protein [Pseudomonadota bacterium]
MELAGSEKNKKTLKDVLHALVASLDKLEDAIDGHLDDRQRLKSLDGEMSNMMLDRSRLAQSLDKVEAKAARLEDANKEVSRRLVTAMDQIRTVLEKNSSKR